MDDWIEDLPKLDLHVHLDGSLRLATLTELAACLPEERRFPDDLDLQQAVTPPMRCSLEDYLRSFEYTVEVLQDSASLERAALELCEDAASENVVYLEMRFAPLLHTKYGLSPREVVTSVLAGMHAAEARLPIHARLILSAMRNESRERSVEVAQLAAQFRKKGVVGFDLAGPEHNYPPILHKTAIGFAHDVGLHLTLHAGEGCCPEQIREVIDLGTDRIGHGIYLDQDPSALERVIKDGIPLELCPTSNLQVSGRMKRYADHPLDSFRKQGIRVTVNTDNRLMSQTSCTRELQVMVDAFNLSRDDVRQLLQNSIDAAFCDDETRAAVQQRVDEAF